MPILARTAESCRDILPFCRPDPSSFGPGPALNAASAKGRGEVTESQVQPADPTERNPNIALSRYITETRPELIVGILLVFVIAIIGVVLWVRFNDSARGRFKKYWAVVVSRFARIRSNQPAAGVSSPSTQSDITRVNTRTDESMMRMSTDTRPPLTRSQDGSQLSVMKTSQLAALPTLLARP
ncbi:hypothetical protein BDW22DRAFT_1341291 [Trametopsis cervina]|nr:hypothetical protein BDW22DRAFT_1341291 [Trametopsis cervina]